MSMYSIGKRMGIHQKEINRSQRRNNHRKKGNTFFMWLFLMVVVLLCYIGVGKNVLAGGKGQEVTILFTHDMHDNFLPTKVEQDGKIIELGGYARLKTAIDDQREKNESVVLVDAGDFSMGTPFQNIFTRQAPGFRILGQLGYDAITLGNHEFDYHASGLTEALNAAVQSGDLLPTIVQSNINFQDDENEKVTESLSSMIQDYTIVERNGIRIGIFGIMGKDAVDMAPMADMEFTDAVEQAKRATKILKEQEKVDIIICLSHSGTKEELSQSEDEQLARKVPDINVIISGHTHSKLEKPIVVGDTIIGSGEEYGKYLGVIKLSKEEKGWKLSNYELVAIDSHWKEDQAIADQITTYKDMVQTEYFDQFGMMYDEVVAKMDFSFESLGDLINNHKESRLANLISDAYLYAVKKTEGENYEPVTAAIIPAGIIRATFLKGQITTADIFSVSCLGLGEDGMPGYPLISVYLTGKELKTICEVDASITPLMADAQLFASGLQYTFNPNRLIFNKVETCVLQPEDGTTQKIEDATLYRVVVGLYSAQMLSVVGEKSFGLLSIVPKMADGTPITNFEQQTIYDTTDGTKKELKEWYALVEYMQSFEKEDGVPTIPAYYSELHNRKIVDDNKNIAVLLHNPNKVTWLVLGVLIVLLAIATLLVLFVLKMIKKIRGKERKGERYEEKLSKRAGSNHKKTGTGENGA